MKNYTPAEVEEALVRLAAARPDLVDYGLMPLGWKPPGMGEVPRDRPGVEGTRRALAALQACEPVPPRSRRVPTSYALKHQLEPRHGYVTNGELIAAALILGIRVRPCPGSPNPDVFARPPATT